jgi:hypothetical protein
MVKTYDWLQQNQSWCSKKFNERVIIIFHSSILKSDMIYCDSWEINYIYLVAFKTLDCNFQHFLQKDCIERQQCLVVRCRTHNPDIMGSLPITDLLWISKDPEDGITLPTCSVPFIVWSSPAGDFPNFSPNQQGLETHTVLKCISCILCQLRHMSKKAPGWALWELQPDWLCSSTVIYYGYLKDDLSSWKQAKFYPGRNTHV